LKHNAVTDLGASARIGYWPRHLTHSAKRLLPTLLAEVPWEQRSVNIFNRNVPQPRLICYMADDGLQYTYSGLTLQPQPWSAGRLGFLGSSHSSFSSTQSICCRWHCSSCPAFRQSSTSLSLRAHCVLTACCVITEC
jgi:alkylated DNA repair dioxygenase AlkB